MSSFSYAFESRGIEFSHCSDKILDIRDLEEEGFVLAHSWSIQCSLVVVVWWQGWGWQECEDGGDGDEVAGHVASAVKKQR